MSEIVYGVIASIISLLVAGILFLRVQRIKVDNEEVLKNRLNIYHESTEMIKPYYLEQKKLFKIDGMRSIEHVSSDIEGHFINM